MKRINKNMIIAIMTIVVVSIGAFGIVYGNNSNNKTNVRFETLSVTMGVNIKIYGDLYQPLDANGNAAESFVYAGTTYISIRALTNLYDAEISWDQKTLTANVNLTGNEVLTHKGIKPALKTAYNVSIEATKDVSLTVNGQRFIPTDGNGNEVSIILYKGVTYVPFRALSKVFGISDDQITWDQASYTASINKIAEEEVITYFETLNNDLDSSNNSESFTSKLKSGFITCVDFLFYGGEIKDYTFNELSSSAKLKVLEMMLNIDEKIDNKLPGYKESIANTTGRIYNTVKNKVVETYLDLTSKFCSNNENICETAKEGLRDIKDAFGITWDFIKNLITSGLDKLSEWYRIWREI